MEKLLNELKIFIEKKRKENQSRPFLSDFENGCIEGSVDTIEDLELLIKNFNC